MTALCLDAGALIQVERGDRRMESNLKAALRNNLDLRTTAVVLAQVWRDPTGRQARLARLMRSVDVRPVTEELGRVAGVLLARAGMSDPIDATLVLIAEPGDRILTSDPADLRRLADAAGKRVSIVHC